MIEVRNLTKRYGDKLAVNDISFTVEDGEILGFLGPNGAGKSTTMNMLTGYISSTSGQALINGVDILEDPIKAKENIGYLPELPPLYQDMTVKAYLNFVYDLKKCKLPRKAHLRDVCDLCKVTDVQNRIIKHLSKGYRQRVGIAQALLGDPEVIILDEPTVGLDPKQIVEIRDLIQKLGKEHTVILSSHILSEVQAVCQKVLIISKGKMVACDTPENLEKLLVASDTIELTVEASEQEAKEILAGVSGIREITAAEGRENRCRLQLQVDKQQNHDKICRDVFFAFSRRSRAILQMTTAKATLEEIFMALTSGEEKQVRNKGGKRA